MFTGTSAKVGQGIDGYCMAGTYQNKTIALISYHAPKDILLADQTEKSLLAIISFGDELKPGVAEVVACLKAMNIKTVMISGDNQLVAELIAKKLVFIIFMLK